MAKKLSKEARAHLQTILGIAKKSVPVRIAELRRQFPQLSPPAAAQMLAEKKGKSMLRFLDDDDKATYANAKSNQIVVTRTISKKAPSIKKAVETILVLSKKDRFVQKHVEEINNAYNAKCYTATFILCRKVLENLIIEVLKTKFSNSSERILYEQSNNSRHLDFSVVLDNLYKKRDNFSVTGKGTIERLKQKVTPFKNDANDKAHSLFHIASKKEIDDADIQLIFDLIEIIMRETNTQTT